MADTELLAHIFRRLLAASHFSERCCGDRAETVSITGSVQFDKKEQGAWHRLVCDITAKGEWSAH
jgi:hypothetical protein